MPGTIIAGTNCYLCITYKQFPDENIIFRVYAVGDIGRQFLCFLPTVADDACRGPRAHYIGCGWSDSGSVADRFNISGRVYAPDTHRISLQGGVGVADNHALFRVCIPAY